jgi:hypothetical protein
MTFGQDNLLAESHISKGLTTSWTNMTQIQSMNGINMTFTSQDNQHWQSKYINS